MMTKYAILIGNGSFPDEPTLHTLRCPLLDVVGLEKVLKDGARGDFNEVIVLKDQNHNEIERCLNKICNQAKKQDLVLVYYSGHGKQSKSWQLYLASLDTEVDLLNSTAVGLNKVYEFINDSRCQKIILILDCCHSGAASRAFKGNIDTKLKQLNEQSQGTYLISASTEHQFAVENLEDKYSLFTKHLIAGLETGAADKNGNGLITLDELYQYVHDNVLAENKDQRPTKQSNDERGELVIAKSGHDLREAVIKNIRSRLWELSQQEDAFIEVLSDTVTWVKLPESKLLPLQKQKYRLLKKLLNDTLTPISFIDAWHKLSPPIHKIKSDEKPKKVFKKFDPSKNIFDKTKRPAPSTITLPLLKILIFIIILGSISGGIIYTSQKKSDHFPSLVDTTWHYIDSDWEYDIVFLPKGILKTLHPNDKTSFDDRWGQNGSKVYFSFNNQSSVYEGQFSNNNFISGTAVNNKQNKSWEWKIVRLLKNDCKQYNPPFKCKFNQ